VERDICLIATAQRPNCSYNKGYIAYFYCAWAKRPYFRFWFEDVFSCFSSKKQKVCNISTSGLFGLLT